MRWLELEYYSIRSGKFFLRDLIIQRSRCERLPKNTAICWWFWLETNSAVEKLNFRGGFFLASFLRADIRRVVCRPCTVSIFRLSMPHCILCRTFFPFRPCT